MKANVWLVAGYVGVVVIAIGNAFGANTGYAINPARDFGPRLFTLASGFGTEPWTAKNSYWVIPITGNMNHVNLFWTRISKNFF